MKILLIDDGDRALEPVRHALEVVGHTILLEKNSLRLLKRVEEFHPDVILIDTESPSRDVLEPLCIVTAHNPLPMVMFSNDATSESIQAATEAGVTAYIVQHVDMARLEGILAVARARFSREQKLREQLAEQQRQTQERKAIDTAKGMLMAARHLSEVEAYQQLQQASMKLGLPMWRIAENIINKSV